MYRCSKCEHKMDEVDTYCPACGSNYKYREETAQPSNEVKSFNSPEKTKKGSRKLLKATIVLGLLLMGVFVIWDNVIPENFKNFISEELPTAMAVGSAEKSIVGSWMGTAEDGSIAYIDFEEEKFKMTYPEAQRSMSGIFLIVDSDTLSIYPLVVDGEKTEGRTELRHKFYFQDDDTLVLNIDGSQLILTRGNYSINNSEETVNEQQTTTEGVENTEQTLPTEVSDIPGEVEDTKSLPYETLPISEADSKSIVKQYVESQGITLDEVLGGDSGFYVSLVEDASHVNDNTKEAYIVEYSYVEETPGGTHPVISKYVDAYTGEILN